jgi:NitT/TauT family transport system substrate-binding protein
MQLERQHLKRLHRNLPAGKSSGRPHFPMLVSLAACAVGAAACSPGSEKARAPDAHALIPIRVAGTDGSNSATPFFAALQQGYFKDAGLDVTFVTLSGGSTSMSAALNSRAIDVGLGSATQWIGDYARGAVAGKIIGEFADNNYVILGADGITDVRQLKGKVFGVSTLNAGDHLYSKAVLSHFGVAPDDVVWLALGSPTGRFSALTAGRVQGIEMPLTNLPPDASARIIVSADDSPVPAVSNAIFAQAAFLKLNRPALEKFLAAIGKGSDWVRGHPADAVSACEQSGSPAESCKAAIQVAVSTKNPYTWSPTTRVNVEAIGAMIPMVASVVPQAKSLTVADLVDTSVATSQPTPHPGHGRDISGK